MRRPAGPGCPSRCRAPARVGRSPLDVHCIPATCMPHCPSGSRTPTASACQRQMRSSEKLATHSAAVSGRACAARKLKYPLCAAACPKSPCAAMPMHTRPTCPALQQSLCARIVGSCTQLLCLLCTCRQSLVVTYAQSRSSGTSSGQRAHMAFHLEPIYQPQRAPHHAHQWAYSPPSSSRRPPLVTSAAPAPACCANPLPPPSPPPLPLSVC